MNGVNNSNYGNGVNDNLKNNNKFLLVLIVGLLIAILCVGGVLLFKMYSSNDSDVILSEEKNNKQNDDNKYEDTVMDVPVVDLPKNEKYTFYKEKTNSVEMNETKFNLVAYYYVDTAMLDEYNMENSEKIKYYLLRREVFINNIKIGGTNLVAAFNDSRVLDDQIEKDDLNNMKIVKDTKNNDAYLYFTLANNDVLLKDDLIINLPSMAVRGYLIDSDSVIFKEFDVSIPGYGLEGIIVPYDKIGDRHYKEVVLDNVVFEGTDLYGTKGYSIYSDDNTVDVHENFIYVIIGDCESYDEFKLYIEDGVLREKKVASYADNILGVGQC